MGSLLDKELCKLAKKGILDDEEIYEFLIDDAHYRCKKCGREATRNQNLCKPKRLKSSIG